MGARPDRDPFVGASAMAARMRETDWSATPLGPPERWPHSLRTAVRILLTSRYAMWMAWGPGLPFLYNDRYAEETLRKKHPWALGQPASEVWREIWPAIGPRIEKVLRTGEATWDSGLLLFLERSGYSEETYHSFSYSPLHDDEGAVRGMLCVVTEETARVIEQRRAELLRGLASRLAASETRQGVYDAVRDTLTPDLRTLPFAAIYELDRDADRARLVAHAGIDPGGAAFPVETAMRGSPWALDRVDERGALVVLDDLRDAHALPTGAWSIPPRRAVAVPIVDPVLGRPSAVFVAGMNPHRAVDEAYLGFVQLFVGQVAAGLASADAREAERRRAAALAQLDRAKTAFFGNVSHELRTPLTLMLAPIEDLLHRAGSGADRDALELVHRNALRLRKLVNTILDFSRIEAGRVEARYRPTDLAQLTVDLASQFRAAIERAGLRLEVECPPLAAPVHVDREMWEKIVLNLLSNAFKFTFEGTIAVSLRAVQGAAELTVRDTGTGIPESELPRVFDRFHRVEGSRGRSHEGTGIGLALVRELVELHGGTVAVESAPGVGTAFTVRVPLGVEHLPAARIELSSDTRAAPAGVSPFVDEALQWLVDDTGAEALELGASEGTADVPAAPARDPARPRIVIADDNADMRAYLARLLRGQAEVEAVGDGEAALAALRAREADLLVTDVMMPVLDGFGLLASVRADPALRRVPVMMLSARAGDEARVEGLAAGADDYLVKPFSARELIARIEALIWRSRLRIAEERHARELRTVFENAPVAIAVLRGREHRFEIANPRYLELVGRDVLGKTLSEAFPELEGQEVRAVLDEVLDTGVPFVGRSFPVRLARAGVVEERFFDLVYEPITGEAPEPTGIVAVGFEVTDLVRARSEAERANRAKDEFLAMLGHELRNPMAPILTALQLMRMRRLEGAEREREVIERQVGHLVALVDDLLDVSRIARGRVELRRQPIEIADVIASAIEQASPLLERGHHDLRVDVPPRGLVVDADADRLAQVVANLLTNAAKYTEPGGRVVVRAKLEGEREIVVRVRDSGIGIAPEMLPRIFDLFTQETQAVDRSQGGLGLGLAIVKSLVELHGGKVEAHSEGRGRGAEMVVRLPASAAQPATASGPRASTDSGPRDRPALRRRVLLVDDNVDSAEMLAAILEASGCDVQLAHDGPSGLLRARERAPDVAILDIGLPVMDGYELARAIRAEPSLAGVRLVALTGYGQAQDRARSLDAGFDVHLVKPVDVERLRALIADRV